MNQARRYVKHDSYASAPRVSTSTVPRKFRNKNIPVKLVLADKQKSNK